jgi:branched-subunit amino acid transport protein
MDPALIALFTLLAAVTFLERGLFIVFLGKRELPAFFRRALHYVPAAVLAAIVTPALFRASGVDFGPVDVRLLAGILAAAVAWRTRSVLATFAVGMTVLWTLTWLAGRGA